jgi:hypothetical protein
LGIVFSLAKRLRTLLARKHGVLQDEQHQKIALASRIIAAIGPKHKLSSFQKPFTSDT